MAIPAPALPHATVGRLPTDPVPAALPGTWNPIYEKVDANFLALLGGAPLVVPDTDALSDFVPAAGREGSRPVAYAVHSGELYLYDPTPAADREFVPPTGSIPADGGGVWLVVRAFPPGGFTARSLRESFEYTRSDPDEGAVDLFGGQQLAVAAVGRPLLVSVCSTECAVEGSSVSGRIVVTVTQGGQALSTVDVITPVYDENLGVQRRTLSGQFVVAPSALGGLIYVRAQTQHLNHYGERSLVVQVL